MAIQTHDLWSLVRGKPQVDPNDLACAVDETAGEDSLDYRTRLLIRDSVNALQQYWDGERLEHWLAGCAHRVRIEAIRREPFDEVGFPSLPRRLMEKTDPEVIRQFLSELAHRINRPTKIHIGGSAALILKGYLSRQTEDIVVVDEVPSVIRSEHQLLSELSDRYGLELAHFQSHYLPSGWEKRVHSVAPFGQLQVYLVDVHDVFLSKLFSARPKDRDDLRLLSPQLDKDTIIRKLKESTQSMLAATGLREKAEINWKIIFGEDLPS